MSLIDKGFSQWNLNNNQKVVKDANGDDMTILTPVPYRWTHGATDYHLGDGLLVYAAIQFLRAKICVCLGSGGGFIPRIMTQARKDLHDQGIFQGDSDMSWGDIGTTFVVDAANGVGGEVDWLEEDSFFKKFFCPRYIIDSTENAFYNFFVKEDITIDYLHIDAGHTYEDVKNDFELYSSRVKRGGIISIHDTDINYQNNHIITDDVKTQNNHADYSFGPNKFVNELGPEWQRFDFFNEGLDRTNPSSTGLTFIKHA